MNIFLSFMMGVAVYTLLYVIFDVQTIPQALVCSLIGGIATWVTDMYLERKI